MSQLERIFFIDRMIRDHGGISAGQIAHKFEVSERQAKRDIEYMRDRLNAPIVWSRKCGHYEYSESWDGLRFADETTFLAFAFLRAILGHYAYVPVVSEETIGMLKAKLGGRYSVIADKVRYELPDLERIDGETALALCQALLETSALDISYTDARGEPSERRIVPLRLVNYAGKWYCVAFDSKTSELRTFAVSRIAVVAASSSTPDSLSKRSLPSEKEIDTFLSSSYGIFKGEPIGRARLRFYGGAARAVREQRWHSDQELSDATTPDGSPALDMSLPVHDWTELLGRALRCGANCEVVGPPEFRARWIEEINRMKALTDKSVG
jgi:predicted DNA-binding transcriptional regulator YafY